VPAASLRFHCFRRLTALPSRPRSIIPPRLILCLGPSPAFSDHHHFSVSCTLRVVALSNHMCGCSQLTVLHGPGSPDCSPPVVLGKVYPGFVKALYMCCYRYYYRLPPYIGSDDGSHYSCFFARTRILLTRGSSAPGTRISTLNVPSCFTRDVSSSSFFVTNLTSLSDSITRAASSL
jgi:hypothetical protein